jgi:hypothetical protein
MDAPMAQAFGRRPVGEPSATTERWTHVAQRRGSVTTQDGAKVTFLMQGRTVFGEKAKGESVGGQNIVMWFEANDEHYKWLNDAMCVVEGVIAGLGAIGFRVFECVNELIAES